MDLIDRLPNCPFTTADAAARAVTKQQVASLVRSGELRRPFRGAYVPAGLIDSSETRAATLRLVVNPTAVVCDRLAAWVWGIDVLEVGELDVPPPIDAFVLRGEGRIRRADCRSGERDLNDDEIVVTGGLRVTTPVRTAIDLACLLPPRKGLAALDAFMRAHGLTHDDLRLCLRRFHRRRGVVQARQLVGFADPEAESPGESWVRYEILVRALPKPSLQQWVYFGGRPLFRLDLAYPHLKIAVEYDGREFHEGKDNEDADEERRTWLRRHGWTVIVVTKDDFTPEAISGWISDLRAALGDRADSGPGRRTGGRSADSTRPGADSTRPGADSTRPGANSTRPGANSTRPGANSTVSAGARPRGGPGPG